MGIDQSPAVLVVNGLAPFVFPMVRFLQNTASCAHQLFFRRVLHNANIFDINELLLSEAMD